MTQAAVEIMPPGSDQEDRDAWLRARSAGVTASEVATILGLSKWDSPMALYFRKRGELEEEPTNYRMALGLALEPYIASCFTEITGLSVSQSAGLLANKDRPWQMCTPDRIVDGTDIPCELKTALSEDEWGASGSDDVPLAYRCQILWQADCLGVDVGYICTVFLRSGEPRWYQVEWDAEDVGVMRDAAEEFLGYLEREEVPPADAAEATQRALRAMYRSEDGVPDAVCGKGLLRSYRAALKAYSDAEARKRLATNKIRLAMGTSARLRGPDGAIVASKRGPNDALYPARGLTG
jgi:putative phage-type endonuclease